MHLNSLKDRLNNPKISVIEISQRNCFIDWLQKLELPRDSKALSVSVGDGVWDYLAFSNNKNITKIIATDIVENPVNQDDVAALNTIGKWEFEKVSAEKPLPFPAESFNLIFHQDVIEHVEKPFLFLSEQYRVLRKGGTLIFGTPNLFRPANLLKLIFGKLKFPVKIGYNLEIGDYIHIQEFYEQQVKILLQEVGFENIAVKYCFFGIHPLNITVSKYPTSKIGRSLCHYLMFNCRK
ncbi:MAG: methyltransferase domain-containing protein [Candidatus Falkowbacteria bacterium]|nr:methyltransferase domain-containing protein [Candidatus Falkowbacteria bacterium]